GVLCRLSGAERKEDVPLAARGRSHKDGFPTVWAVCDRPYFVDYEEGRAVTDRAYNRYAEQCRLLPRAARREDVPPGREDVPRRLPVLQKRDGQDVIGDDVDEEASVG